MNIRSSIKTLLLALVGMLFTTVVGQAPIFPFPSQAPVAQLSAQPFLEQNQVVVGKASVAQIVPTQRSYIAPTLASTPATQQLARNGLSTSCTTSGSNESRHQ